MTGGGPVGERTRCSGPTTIVPCEQALCICGMPSIWREGLLP